MPVRRLWPRIAAITILFLIINQFSIVYGGGEALTARYEFSSNTFIFVHLEPSAAKELCGGRELGGGVFFAVIDPNSTEVTVSVNGGEIEFHVKISDLRVLFFSPRGDLVGECRSSLDYTVHYNYSQILMPVYNGSIAGGFPYLATKLVAGNTSVLVASIGTRDFEIRVPKGFEQARRIVSGNVLVASPIISDPGRAEYVAGLFREVLGGVGKVRLVRDDTGAHVEVVPYNASIAGILAYSVVLGPPPGPAYQYGGISVPASLVSASPASTPLAVLDVGAYKVLSLDGIFYFTVRGGRVVYVVSLDAAPPVSPNGGLRLYQASYRWDNGLLLNATFTAYLANAAAQGLILQGPLLDHIAVPSAVYGVVYGLIPPGRDPADYLASIIADPLKLSIPLDSEINVHLVEYTSSNPGRVTVEPKEELGPGIIALASAPVLLLALAIHLRRRNKRG